MQYIRKPGTKKSNAIFLGGKFFLSLLTLLYSLQVAAQTCPPNIDFETGTFDFWKCYTGNVSAIGGQNVMSLQQSNGPVSNQHTMYSAGQGNQVDPYGGFPVNCPNGSGHSIRLGNDFGGGLAEGISYEFTIPAGQDTYSLIYHYAVVFQDPNHLEHEQPRLEIEALNVTDNEIIYCSSFTFIPHGTLLPGFFISPTQVDTTNVWCKDWTAVSINLNNNAGKTIRLFFRTGDCTFVRHFGYAYIDINTECSSEFVGAAYCPADTTITVTAPFGYQQYTWFNDDFSQTLGTQQTISFTPPPPSGTVLAVEIVPYDGYGCLDTLYALLIDTLTVTSNAGPDNLSCNGTPVPIGANSKPGLVYRWSPATGLSNPNIANPRAGPLISTRYTLTTSSLGGGCVSTDMVDVVASVMDTSLRLIGKDAYCITSGDSSVLLVQPTLQIQWYKDNRPISGSTGLTYKAIQSGIYRAQLMNDKGCSISTAEKEILIEIPQPGIRYPVQNAVVNSPLPLQARAIGVEVIWKPAIFLSNSVSFAPTFNGTEEKLYTIEITTRSGCTAVDTQMVKVFKEVKFYVPSAFTPNNDGLNDFLKPLQAGIKDFRYFRVYNRWGALLFDINGESRGWDGTFKGITQNTQVVVWVAEGIGYDNKLYRQKGTSVLIR